MYPFVVYRSLTFAFFLFLLQKPGRVYPEPVTPLMLWNRLLRPCCHKMTRNTEIVKRAATKGVNQRARLPNFAHAHVCSKHAHFFFVPSSKNKNCSSRLFIVHACNGGKEQNIRSRPSWWEEHGTRKALLFSQSYFHQKEQNTCWTLKKNLFLELLNVNVIHC